MDRLKEFNIILLCDFEDYSNDIYIKELKQIKEFLSLLGERLSPHYEDSTIDNGFILFVRDKTEYTDLYQSNNNLDKNLYQKFNFNYCHTPKIGNIQVEEICDWWSNGNKLNLSDEQIDAITLINEGIDAEELDLNKTLEFITSRIGYEGKALTEVVEFVFNNPNELSTKLDEYE